MVSCRHHTFIISRIARFRQGAGFPWRVGLASSVAAALLLVRLPVERGLCLGRGRVAADAAAWATRELDRQAADPVRQEED
jgi:hypothetical protein